MKHSEALVELNNQLEGEGRQLDMDSILLELTSAMEVAEDTSLQPLIMKWTGEEKKLQVFVGRDEELNLGALISEGLNFVGSDRFNINKQRGVIEVPITRDAISRGFWYRIALSHEVGHALDTDYEILDERSRIEPKDLTTTVEKQNAILEMEVNAWNYGKSVADVIGIDEIRYEDLMHHALKAYFMRALEQISLALEDEKATAAVTTSIYNPLLQEVEELSLDALRSRIEELYEKNFIFRADDRLKEVESK